VIIIPAKTEDIFFAVLSLFLSLNQDDVRNPVYIQFLCQNGLYLMITAEKWGKRSIAGGQYPALERAVRQCGLSG